MAATLGLDGKLKFTGHSSAVHDYLRRSSLLVIPSRIEAFGMVAIEAMQAGKPVVACRTGGLLDIVVHGKTGLLIETDDHIGMASAIVNLLKNPGLANSMGMAGRSRVEEHFTVRKMTASFADFYTGLLREAA
jgi:glycosyltransferase involved in cell wall biosynthesis